MSTPDTTTISARPLLPGLGDPVDDAQGIFRELLMALSRPGIAYRLPNLPATPDPLHPATGAVLLTLIDHETALWLQSPTEELTAWLRFHCSAPLAVTPADAVFAVIDRPLEMPPLAAFAQGVPEYPDRSATVIVQVAGFAPDGLRLTGPGIAREQHVGINGLPAGFWRTWQDNQARAPLGVDLLFVAGDVVLGLPRSTSVEIVAEGVQSCM
ncbi:MAG: phosphonate C-P lyase system protein PhnH [Gammaproteobacteria bacterium]|nr:phosphonate C-P lyase system protein PhnH [Rhodocyclaceae bacterium]MBU3908806.1 phosphonate C-P lyase system protein PhnH [Gammaproteobacteria bacterium]MBU3988415.1 phosphonate C-P lyase system protein PhnH [Gammaproteobacteria bacterium]MBU4004834.1 phosphonate C-P lyase system protein PhnH [Gammaproteobacteria bacterium]MBU4021437.1 phosphonate C-P lyase system protein PhnH [Gammaproteobacteria bacterium]